MNWIKPFFSFQGRANRQRYWFVSLSVYAAFLVTGVVAIILPVLAMILALPLLIGGLWVGLATTVRRLHDRGKSAWWLVPMYAPLMILSFLAAGAEGAGEADAALGLNVLAFPFSIWIFVSLGCLKGTVGSNSFGPDPLNPSPAEVFS